MNSRRSETTQRGTILILALWALGLLTVFAVSVGTKIQQKIFLVSRIENRTQVHYAAEAGILKAVSLLKSQVKAEPKITQKTISLFDNPKLFKAVALGTNSFDVSYPAYDRHAGSGRTYGIIDEERKINVNTADGVTLERLFSAVTDLSEDARKELAAAIIDWRDFGESEAGGFLSDAYYENLKYPYPQKKGPFETLDELLLLKGMTASVYGKIFSLITVYGNGKVNLNTAPKPVLRALGMSEELVEKILIIRRGQDGREDTPDDVIFPSESEIPLMQILTKVTEPEEAQLVFDLYVQNKIGMESSHYMIQSRGYLSKTNENKELACVFDVNSGKIKYWREY